MSSTEWREYLAGFHADNAGITEELLAHTTDGDVDPYRWLASQVRPSARVLDLACGSGPLERLHPGPWVGVDVSHHELERARGAGAEPVLVADGTALPFVSGVFDTVVCSMALMLIQPIEMALSEVARVLTAGGRLVALLPTNKPLNAGDAVRYGQLLAAIRGRLRYPNDAALADAEAVLASAGLSPVADERRRFECHVADAHTAALCVSSLYLPDTPADRIERAFDVTRRWIGHTIGVPLRLMVAERR